MVISCQPCVEVLYEIDSVGIRRRLGIERWKPSDKANVKLYRFIARRAGFRIGGDCHRNSLAHDPRDDSLSAIDFDYFGDGDSDRFRIIAGDEPCKRKKQEKGHAAHVSAPRAFQARQSVFDHVAMLSYARPSDNNRDRY
jgi:hypothetical protein